jgi:hypothetical protein
VVTTPLSTHVRENDAILHAETPRGMAHAIERLRAEWRHDGGYDERCRRARREGEAHGFDEIYPRLKDLLVSPPTVEAGTTRTEVRV